MKNWYIINLKIIYILIFIIIFAGCVTTPNITFDAADICQIRHIAVFDFYDAPGAEAENSGVVVSSSIVNEFLNVKDITVVEREKLLFILEEQKLSMSGLIDENSIIEAGKILGVDTVVIGSVSEYDTSSIPIFLGLFTYYKDIYNVAANMRIINVKTGKVLLGGECSAKSNTSYQNAATNVSKALLEKILEIRGKVNT